MLRVSPARIERGPGASPSLRPYLPPRERYTKYTSLPSASWRFMHNDGGEEAEFAGLDQLDRELLTMARVRPEGMRWKEFLGDGERPRFNSRTLSRHLKGLVARGFMRREEVEVKRERYSLYLAVPLNERRAMERFEWARRGILDVTLKELPSRDLSDEAAAEELAGLLGGIYSMRRQLVASLLRRSLEKVDDMEAIHHFVGRTGWFDEVVEDMMLLALLGNRGVAPRAIEIWERPQSARETSGPRPSPC